MGILQEWRNAPQTKTQKLFVAIITVQWLLCLALAIWTFTLLAPFDFSEDIGSFIRSRTSVVVFLTIAIAFSFDGLANENIPTFLAHFALSFYADMIVVIEFRTLAVDGMANSTLASEELLLKSSVTVGLVAQCIADFVALIVGIACLRQFGEKLYKMVGSSMEVRRTYRNYQFCLAALRVSSLVVIQLLVFLAHPLSLRNPADSYFTSSVLSLVAGVVVIVRIIAPWQAVRRENKMLGIVYLISECILLGLLIPQVPIVFSLGCEQQPCISTTTIVCLEGVLQVTCVASFLLCLRQFGTGRFLRVFNLVDSAHRTSSMLLDAAL